MRDTTQWRKDVDRTRKRLLEAFRAGDMDVIVHATQVLQVLLHRADRVAPPAARSRLAAASAMPLRQRGDMLTVDTRCSQQQLEISAWPQHCAPPSPEQ